MATVAAARTNASLFRDPDSLIPMRHSDLMALPPPPTAAEPAMATADSSSLPGCVDESPAEEKQYRPANIPPPPALPHLHADMWPRVRELIERSSIMQTADPAERKPSEYSDAVCRSIYDSADRDLLLLSLFCTEQRDLMKLKRPLGGVHAARPQNVAELCFLLERWRAERMSRKSTQQMLEEQNERMQMQERRQKAQMKRANTNIDESGLSSLIQRLLSSSQPRAPRIPETQRRLVIGAIEQGALLARTGATQADIEELPLEQLLPPEGGVGGATRLIAAVDILAGTGVQAQSFQHLKSLLQQHWIHATPQPHFPPPAEQRRGTRSSLCAIM